MKRRLRHYAVAAAVLLIARRLRRRRERRERAERLDALAAALVTPRRFERVGG
jgi:hypothetical protein